MNLPEKKEQGQGLVEYALLIALIAVIVIAILTILGPQITLVYARVIGGFNGDVIDVAAGDQAVIVGFDADNGCTRLTGIRFVAVDDNGQIITEGTVTAQLFDGETPRGAVVGTPSGSGIVTVSGLNRPISSCNNLTVR